MTPTRSGSNYSIQSNGSVPGHSSHKSKRQECQHRGEAQMEHARTSTSSQSTSGNFSQSLDTHHELISSSEEVHGARKDRGTSEGLDTHVFQRTIPTDISLVEKPKHVIRGSEEEVGPGQGQHPSGSSPSIHQQKSPSTGA
ncbi:hypothetical protein O181_125269 [Austropuccinia psidii MF-1]|uniref:Uncharacterized protein n=1 Tax=Austropuccinia psidii MF-1 TaxID=1389203 RepID=A0A9Q3KR19_9BASI|nr:hypothetical protein [Austropuccinia psidii MF-1]